MLIEINHHRPVPGGTVVAHRLVQEGDVVSLDPHATDPAKSVLRVRGSAGGFVEATTDLTLAESYAAFKARYAAATSSTRLVEATALESETEGA